MYHGDSFQAGQTDSTARLTATDLSNLRLETPAAPTHIGALLIIDAAPLGDSTGQLGLDEIRRRLELRLQRVPALRRRLFQPGPFLGRPAWVDDKAFDIRNHILGLPLPPGAGDAELLEAAEQLMGSLLHRSRPLWELWLITGLSRDRLGALLKLHHAIADGLAAVTILSSLIDFDARVPDPQPVRWSPAPEPRPWPLLVDNVSRRLTGVKHAKRVLMHPLRASATARATGGDLLRGLRGPAAPPSSINRRVAAGRLVRFARFDLTAVSTRAHAAGGKVNDVVLDLVAGGLRELLIGRGEPVAGLELIASVPVSLRAATDAGRLGNAVGVMTVPLDVGQADAQRRLESIVAATRRAKREQHPAHVQAFMAWLAAMPIAQAFIARQRLVNLFVTNIAGPPVPAYLLGARIVDVMPIVSPSGNVAIAFCAFSYAGCLYLVATVDAAACPDVDRLIAGAEDAWHNLCDATALVDGYELQDGTANRLTHAASSEQHPSQ